MTAPPPATIAPDPLSEVLSLLELESAQCSRFEAFGPWALSFTALARIKFVSLLRGECWIIIPEAAPYRIAAGDTFLLTNTSYVIASDVDAPRVDGGSLFNADSTHVVRLGGDETALIGGAFVFHGEKGDLITDALPPFLRVSGSEPASAGLRETLAMLERELASGLMGSVRMTRHLAEMLLLHAFRAFVTEHGAEAAGWIGALSDPRIGLAITLLHTDAGRDWTVAELASAVGISRSAFALRFKGMVGEAPLIYLRRWRMLRARHALRGGKCSFATLARTLGYSSESAFGNAFKRMFGHSPGSRARSPDSLRVITEQESKDCQAKAVLRSHWVRYGRRKALDRWVVNQAGRSRPRRSLLAPGQAGPARWPHSRSHRAQTR